MLDDVKKFLNHPFSADMTAIEWGAFIGFLMVTVILWNIILSYIKETV